VVRARALAPNRAGLFGAALIYGDGIITPAISVLSAIEGLNVATDVCKPHIVPIAVAILLALFAIQNRGTAKIGAFSDPVMMLWFITIAVLGIRVAAIASFHGGNLATDKPDSPHLFVKSITGRVYVAGAIEDASFPEEQKNRLDKALTEAGVDHLVETYPGARHGFAVPDVPVFDPAASERHWAALFGLFHETFAVDR
jgi:hypothetical protein